MERPEDRADDAAREGDRRTSRLAHRREEAARLLEAGADDGMAREPVELGPVEDDDAVGLARSGAVLGEQAGQVAAPRDNGEALHALIPER